MYNLPLVYNKASHPNLVVWLFIWLWNKKQQKWSRAGGHLGYCDIFWVMIHSDTRRTHRLHSTCDEWDMIPCKGRGAKIFFWRMCDKLKFIAHNLLSVLSWRDILVYVYVNCCMLWRQIVRWLLLTLATYFLGFRSSVIFWRNWYEFLEIEV